MKPAAAAATKPAAAMEPAAAPPLDATVNVDRSTVLTRLHRAPGYRPAPPRIADQTPCRLLFFRALASSCSCCSRFIPAGVFRSLDSACLSSCL